MIHHRPQVVSIHPAERMDGVRGLNFAVRKWKLQQVSGHGSGIHEDGTHATCGQVASVAVLWIWVCAGQHSGGAVISLLRKKS